MFVPKRCVLLTAAVDRLAEARRTADQANDDGKNAAREELRREFHSGSMSATVIHPGSGVTHTIFPECWALEIAPTWLEQGECLLTPGLVYPRLDSISFNKDPTVSIFMSEHDLQRLMAKQEVEQEAAPPQRPLQPEGASEAATPKRRGRKKKGDGSYAIIDRPLLDAMKELISSHQAASPEEAARMLAEKAFGSGSQESKAARLAKRYRKNASGPNSLGSGS